MLEQGHKLEVGGESMIGLCIASQRAHIALDVGAEPVRFDNPLLPNTHSELALPLISRGQVIGAMTVQSDQEAAFTEVDIATLQTMADQVANAIENARLYAQVQQDIEELRKLDELKSDFVAVVSHELRTPLTSVIAYSETLLQGRVGALTSQQQHFVEVIRQGAYEQLRIVDDLLDLSRLESGRMTFRLEETFLAPIVEEVLQTATPMAESKNQRLINQVPAGLPLIRADPDRVRQVLLNLVSNGVKFTPPEGRITVAAEVVASDAVQVAVHDTGIGIAPEHQHLIFEKFTQVEKPLTRQHRGIGLGLPIARVLVELHGGRIWVESTPGQGSTFYFTLPLAKRIDE
jgi:signal transduction histidine kinase